MYNNNIRRHHLLMVDMQISCMIRVDISCKHLRIYIPPIQIEESVSANMHQSSIDNGGISDNLI